MWNVTEPDPDPLPRRRDHVLPGSTASTVNPRSTSDSVSLPVPTPHLEHARAGTEAAALDSEVDERRRVAGTNLVVRLGDLVEDLREGP